MDKVPKIMFSKMQNVSRQYGHGIQPFVDQKTLKEYFRKQ